MTRAEALAYNAGVHAVLDLAARSAAAVEPLIATKPTRLNFAHGALVALAVEGQVLLKNLPHADTAEESSPRPPAPSPGLTNEHQEGASR